MEELQEVTNNFASSNLIKNSSFVQVRICSNVTHLALMVGKENDKYKELLGF